MLSLYPTFFYIKETFVLSGIILMSFTFLAILVMTLYSKLIEKRSFFTSDKSASYILKLFLLYLLFAFIEQLFFQFVVLETFYHFLVHVQVTVLVGSIFFAIFHLQKYPKPKRILFATSALIKGLIHNCVYLTYGTIFWTTLSLALIATFYYTFLYKEDILKSRF